MVLSLVTSAARAQTRGPAPRDDAFFDATPLADRIQMHLDYAGAPGCAEAELFKDAVLVREYRWDPFAASSRWRLTIRVKRKGRGYEGSGELRTPENTVRWRHTFRGPLRCYDVIAGLALDVAVAIRPKPDPSRDPPPPDPPPPAPPPPCPACPACAASPVEPAPPPLRAPEAEAQAESRAFAVRLGAAVWPEVVASGWGSLGLSVDAGVRYRGVSIGVEAHGDPPLGSSSYADGRPVSFARLSGRMLVCAHWGWFVGCGVGDVGRIWFPNHVQPLPASILYGAVGARAGLEFPVVPRRFFLRAALDVLAPIQPAKFSMGDTRLFEVAGPSVGLGLGVLFELPP